MTHENYNELQKKMDKLYDDFIDLGADTEAAGEDMNKVSEWLDTHMAEIIKWADTDDEEVLTELHDDYLKLREMLEL